MTEPLGVPLSETDTQSFTEEMQAGMEHVESEKGENGAVTVGEGFRKAVVLPAAIRKEYPSMQESSGAISLYVFLTESGVKELVFDSSVASNLSERKFKAALDKAREAAKKGEASGTDLGYLPPNPDLKNGREMFVLGDTVEFTNQPQHQEDGYIRDISNPADLGKAIEASKAHVQEMRRPERIAQQASLQAVRSIMPPSK